MRLPLFSGLVLSWQFSFFDSSTSPTLLYYFCLLSPCAILPGGWPIRESLWHWMQPGPRSALDRECLKLTIYNNWFDCPDHSNRRRRTRTTSGCAWLLWSRAIIISGFSNQSVEIMHCTVSDAPPPPHSVTIRSIISFIHRSVGRSLEWIGVDSAMISE